MSKGSKTGVGTWLFFAACIAFGLAVAFWPRG